MQPRRPIFGCTLDIGTPQPALATLPHQHACPHRIGPLPSRRRRDESAHCNSARRCNSAAVHSTRPGQTALTSGPARELTTGGAISRPSARPCHAILSHATPSHPIPTIPSHPMPCQQALPSHPPIPRRRRRHGPCGHGRPAIGSRNQPFDAAESWRADSPSAVGSQRDAQTSTQPASDCATALDGQRPTARARAPQAWGGIAAQGLLGPSLCAVCGLPTASRSAETPCPPRTGGERCAGACCPRHGGVHGPGESLIHRVARGLCHTSRL
jgi:hypothetical protein